MLQMGLELDVARWAASETSNVRDAISLIFPEESPQTTVASTNFVAPHDVYAHRALLELDRPVSRVDCGIVAGPSPRTNACLWLSVVAGFAHLVPRVHSVPDVALLQRLEPFLERIAGQPATTLQCAHRKTPRLDPLGIAADILRSKACDDMLTDLGVERWLPFFAQLVGNVNSPEGNGVAVQQYREHVAALRVHAFADQINLVQIASMLRIRIVVIPERPDWPIQRVSATATNLIILGNNDSHYVWLKPLDE